MNPFAEMIWQSHQDSSFAPGAALLPMSQSLLAQVPLISDAIPGTNVLRTGGGMALVSAAFPLNIPSSSPLPLLKFGFGFATDDRDQPGSFADSFSITLQNSDRSATALLLTADVNGVTWAPPTSQGLVLNPNDFTRQPGPFPNLSPQLSQKISYSVSLAIPKEFTGRSAVLYLDLFDNLNSLASLGYLNDVTVEAGPSTNVAPFFVLQSSASAVGPFADEDEAQYDSVNQTVTLPSIGHRFYRLRSDSEVRITSFKVAADQEIFGYEFASPIVILQSAANVTGPYIDEANASVDLATRTIRIARPNAGRFYRVRSNLRIGLVRSQVVGGELLFSFEYEPLVLALQSSARVAGPYADESNVAVDPSGQTMRLSRSSVARFYRIRSDAQIQLTSIQLVRDRWVFHYTTLTSGPVLQSAESVTGPYADAPGAVANAADRTIKVSRIGQARFYRLRSDAQTRLTRIRMESDQAVLSYE